MAKIDTRTITVPASMVDGWQEIVDLVADITECPAALIMRIHEHDIEVFISSKSQGNPYAPHARDSLGHGLYCETVIRERRPLVVPNALNDPNWDKNPDIKLGMICYCGLPVYWPDNSPFGTICILDSKERHFSERTYALLGRFQSAIEGHLQVLYHKAEVQALNEELERKVRERTQSLAELSARLLKEIEQRTAAEGHLEFHRSFDPLTHLPNRATLTERLRGLLPKIRDDEQLTLIYFGLKNFKSVNDSYGYLAGDQMLVSLAQRLSVKLPEDWILSRIAGVEFVLAARHPRGLPHAEQVIDRVLHDCAIPFNVNNNSITVKTHLGVAIFPMDASDSVSLLQRASAAMSICKKEGAMVSFFGTETQKAANERLLLESHLLDALRLNELEVYYQPLMSLRQGSKIIGAEALLRWHSPELGNVGPDRFIPLAESNGQIIEIGNFVLHQALEKASHWFKLTELPFKIAINISPLQFRERHFVEHIEDLLRLYQVPPQSLELEITEGILLQDEHHAKGSLAALRAIGVSISLDDFGTGYSSLSYLQKYSFDTLKIDRSFVSHLEFNEQNRELTRAIIAMAHKLKLAVIAEGVENAFQESFIRDEGCDYAQGFLYGKPVTAEVFHQLLRAQE
ncbi:EAL domain-containing protein [Shewanella sp. JM162201]|uniref:EAL domain-containing protein n=1 Tax=Shewanella jiangmenensis TaxID=2837387 RepID=A0ABS5V296_9GAMM|nr:GGDEF and EAL domain-containing protein [Shewanella jiangmenensis]MBT1443921.1 EAL domain-containing protein [Shewanella jiangmenensis]